MKEGWETKELCDCLSYIKNGANIKQAKGASGIPITRIETLSGGEFHRDRLGYADIFDPEKFESYILDDADILMSHINSKAFIGRSVIYHKQGNEQIIHGMNLLRLKFYTNLIYPEFANYYFKCAYFRNEVAKIRKDAVNQSSMAISDLKKISIPTPPISEQQHIVEELDLLSSIIEKKKAQLNELDNMAQSLFYEMFGDPITNEKEWKIKKLGDISNYSKTRIKAEEVSIKNYVGVDNLLQKCEGKTDAAKVPEAINHIEYIKDDVLIGNIRPYLKKIWLAKYRGGCNGDVLVIRRLPLYQNTVNPIYLFKCLSDDAFFAYDMQFSKGEKMPRGDKKEILKYPIAIPPIHLQNQFASKIEAVEHQKELIKKSIKEVETLFNSRMDYYFN